MNLDFLGKQPTKQEKEKIELASKIKAFIDEVKIIEQKHKLRLLPALDIKGSGIVPSFRFEEIKDDIA